MRQKALSHTDASPSTAKLDALLAAADGPVVFAEAGGIRLAGSENFITVGEIAGSSRLPAFVGAGMPTLVIAPDGVEAAFHLTARLAALGITSVKRVRLERDCAAIDKVEVTNTGWRISCRRR
jgi:Fe2+ transport system protein FeoA